MCTSPTCFIASSTFGIASILNFSFSDGCIFVSLFEDLSGINRTYLLSYAYSVHDLSSSISYCLLTESADLADSM